MSRKYYNSDWDICNRETVYGSWKDGSDIYKNKKGYFIIQYDLKKEMFYTKPVKFTPDPKYVLTRTIKSKKYKHCIKTRKQK
jgi:hypothetical protein